MEEIVLGTISTAIKIVSIKVKILDDIYEKLIKKIYSSIGYE